MKAWGVHAHTVQYNLAHRRVIIARKFDRKLNLVVVGVETAKLFTQHVINGVLHAVTVLALSIAPLRKRYIKLAQRI